MSPIVALRAKELVADAQGSIELLSWKIGLVLLALGFMHFFNLLVFSRMRARANRARAPFPERGWATDAASAPVPRA